jgi:hypothetical protein
MPVGPSVAIEVGGKLRYIRYDMNAICAIEDALDIGLGELGTVMGNGKLGPMRTLLWAGLLHEQPELTEPEVGAWMDGDNLSDIGDAVGKALSQIFGESEGNQTGDQAGTGKVSAN